MTTVANILNNTPLYKSKFKRGDTVYYNGTDGSGQQTYAENGLLLIQQSLIKKDTPYEVVKCLPKGVSHYGLSIKLPDGRAPYFLVDDFISEIEYNDEKRKKSWKESRIATPIKKNNFKTGDVVYYNGKSELIEHDQAFRLWSNRNPDIFDIFINKNWSQIPVSVINRDFISKEEYEEKKKSGNVSRSDSNKSLGNYDSFVEKFKSGGTVYYIGDKIKRLKKDTPYKIEFYNHLTGLVRIDGNVHPESDFISDEQYERLKMLNDDMPVSTTTIEEVEKGKEKSEVQLKMKIYTETKKNKLIWYKPHLLNEEWFRTKINLNQPLKSYLRIDVKRPVDKWEMIIYFHRNKVTPDTTISSDDNMIIIKHYKETQILLALARIIDIQIFEREEYSQDQQTYDKKNYRYYKSL